MQMTRSDKGLPRVDAMQTAPFDKSSIDMGHVGLDAGITLFDIKSQLDDDI